MQTNLMPMTMASRSLKIGLVPMASLKEQLSVVQ